MMFSELVFIGFLATATARVVDFNPKIVGGTNVLDGQLPYQVSVRIHGGHVCGGSIINSRTILTAAHCLIDQEPEDVTIVAGSVKLSEGGDTYEATSLVTHARYDPNAISNDIALIKLKHDVRLDYNIQPIELNKKYVAEDEWGFIAGWGTTKYPGSVPNNLQMVYALTISVDLCQRYPQYQIVSENQICTTTERREGACHGDSGGPLVFNNQQIGIVSWGYPCAAGYPDVHTRISSYLDWINENL